MKKNMMRTALALMAGCLLSLSSCKDDVNDVTPAPNAETGGNEAAETLKTCKKKVYFDDISTEEPNLVTALHQRFPNSVGIGEAEIIFTTKQHVAEIGDEVEDRQAKGALVVIFDPGLENGWDIPEYVPVEGVSDIFFAANNNDQYYTMAGEPEEDDDDTGEHVITPEEQEQIDASVEYGRTHPDEDPVETRLQEDNNYPSVNYFNMRLTPFIEWIEEMDAINAEDDAVVTKAPMPGVPNYENVKINVRNEGAIYEREFPLNYDEYVASGAFNTTKWHLKGNSSVSVRFNIYPIYMQSSNGESKAGDYYIVIGRVTPHSKQLWHPREEKGGLFNWGRCRLFGLWFKEMNASFSICSDDKGTLLDGVRFEMDPLPENDNDSRNYTNGVTRHVEGSITGGYWKERGWGGEGKLSAGGSWSSTESFSLTTLNFNTNSYNGEVKGYWYTTKLVTLNYNNIDDYDEYFKPACYNDFNAHLAWVWHVPSGKGGVGDNKDAKLYMKTKLDVTYSTWYHWRAANRFDGNRRDHKKDYDAYISALPTPNRKTWGIIMLKNAFPSSTVITNIRYIKGDKEVKSDVNSYTNNETAMMALPEGSYDVTFEHYNPGQGNKFLGKYCLKNIQVKQGGNFDDVTTEVSTVNAEKIQ